MVQMKKYRFFWLILLLVWGCEKEATVLQETSTCNTGSETGEKINGISFVGPVHEIDASAFVPVQQVNSNYVTIMPFAFGSGTTPALSWNGNSWWGERDPGVIKCTEMAHAKGLKVMIKPHVYYWSGVWVGDFEMTHEADWQTFETAYRNYILHYAHLADSLGAASFSVGVEWKKFVAERPDFWSELIDTVRTIYHGDLTYAANWDAYLNFPHWDKLDYIGVDAYFPVASSAVPSVQEFKNGWEPHLQDLKNFSEMHNKPVVFTEFGYRSMEYNGLQPWDSSSGNVYSGTAQANAYQAVLEQLWAQDWFKGGFIWKWYDYHHSAGGAGHNRYTPQNKPAEAILAHHYGLHR